MPRPKTHKGIARAHMKSLGVYKPEFEPIIGIYAQLRDQYDELTARFVDSEYKYDEQTMNGTKKSPLVTTLEALRRDILAYAAQLGLTPQGLLKMNESAFKAPKKNVLGDLLKGLPDL